MITLRSIALASALAFTFAAGAQTSAMPANQDHSAHHPPGQAVAAPAPADRMAMMDAHMKAMRDMHEKMSRARTPEERNALMAEHMKLMQQGMGMMGGMGPVGAASAPMGMSAREQMMDKRMEMMQSMMQMMMDRMAATPAKP